ncbi:P1 family peptidase [Catenuloplanes indicus]|uniref:L-aminopeptidase/D-esterase-like protein n=1 Tax=Catenuloplanes indicus TaxID=137267 RepID=A0AAE3W6X7_9ACTN|nr:P1 family peptidase [Catenuloplanes indicus]MDQ0369550.1 L-aminopeptidase/D-esterase-like protein [Catenuloplanes indicus]
MHTGPHEVTDSPAPVEVPAGVRVGHWTGDGTGVTVVLPPAGTVGSGEVRGGAPATREFALLSPERMVGRVDAVVLSGGSAFGLAAGDGVMRALRDRGEGFPTAHGPVPIVVGMSVFDASVAATPPDAAAGRAALLDALAPGGALRVGRVGAGAGAMSGRWLGRQDPGGFGAASARDAGGALVTAFAVVNALGVVIGPDGSPVRTAPGHGTPATGGAERPFGSGRENTTLVVVVTDAALSKSECLLVAQSGHDGMARALHPSHTRFDGDAVVALATGTAAPAGDGDLDTVRATTIGVVAAAIRDAVAPHRD